MSEIIRANTIWAVSVEGDENDLLAASQYFSEVADGRIMQISMNAGAPRWVMISERLGSLADEFEIASEAQAILNVMNGVLFVDDHRSVPIRLAGSIHKRAANGNWGVAILAPAAHARMESRRGVPVEQTAVLARALNGADDLRKVLACIANQPGWFEVYIAIEYLAKMFGGEHNLLKQAWATGLPIKLLKESANFHRHAKAYDPPGRLSLAQAQRSAAEIVRAALKAA
ncbi:hypothetical protein [Tardiphaga sp. OK245]|uniref:hypothetical protein n=1 Tax=Tardiphaga sp. OK245 TaxID=1855306 RepID=UPI0008A74988|nr:hypothetical protein [Tardiphaga sp. OK245]SEH40888.1 hypothetical protein SAMN05216367_0080 [Tardiphaga sp. OK245]